MRVSASFFDTISRSRPLSILYINASPSTLRSIRDSSFTSLGLLEFNRPSPSELFFWPAHHLDNSTANNIAMAARRALNATDESAVSLTSSAIEDAHSGFRFLDATELQDSHGADLLRRSLTTRSIVSITSSFAERLQAAATRPQLQVIREIGEGLQGTIFEQVGKPLVLKKEKPQNASMPCNLSNEFCLHQRISNAFERYHNHPSINCDVSIPVARQFIASCHNDAWATLLPKLPAHCQVKSDMVEMERVLPLPKIIRRALVEEFYPFPSYMNEEEKIRTIDRTLNMTPNKHCLVRPYLGIPRKRYAETTFSLRNFILGINDLQRFETDFVALSQTMGRAYAILHWAAHVNGDDIEFVLGSSLAAIPGRDPRFQHRKIGLYLIDFGQCDRVDMGRSAGEVYQSFRGAMVTGDNACFIPNPRHTKELFRIFKDSYSTTAKQILEESSFEKGKFDIDELMVLYQEYVEDLL